MEGKRQNHDYHLVDLGWLAGADGIIRVAEEFLGKAMMEFAMDNVGDAGGAFEISEEDLRCAMFTALETAGHRSTEHKKIVDYWFDKYWQ